MHMHTRLEFVDQVVAFVKERHPYDVPNVTAIPLIAGNLDYLDWIAAETVEAGASASEI
jgi:periplasmic divalent cation tolerance protein